MLAGFHRQVSKQAGKQLISLTFAITQFEQAAIKIKIDSALTTLMTSRIKRKVASLLQLASISHKAPYLACQKEN